MDRALRLAPDSNKHDPSRTIPLHFGSQAVVQYILESGKSVIEPLIPT